MPIPLDQNARPSAKLPNIGSGIEVCIIGTEQVPWTEYGTGATKYGQNGQPRKQLVVTGIVVNSSGAMTGPMGNDRPVQVGETLDIYLHGGNWGSFIDATKAARTAGQPMQVGDILQWWYAGDVPSQQPGAQPRKDRKCAIRRARPDEQHWVTQAEALHYSMGFPAKAAAAASAPAPEDASEPFPASQQYPAQQPYSAHSPQQPQYGGQPPFGQQEAPQPAFTGYPTQQPTSSNQPGF